MTDAIDSGLRRCCFAAVGLVREALLSLRISTLHFDNLDPD